MAIEEFERLESVADDALLEFFRFADVIVVQDREFTLPDDGVVTQFVVVKLALFAVLVDVSTGGARDFKEFADFVFADEKEILAVGVEAVKPLNTMSPMPLTCSARISFSFSTFV